MKFTFGPDTRPLDGITIKRAIHRGGFGEVYYAVTDAGKEACSNFCTTIWKWSCGEFRSV